MSCLTIRRLLNWTCGSSYLVFAAAFALWLMPSDGRGAVTAGGIAILGFTDHNDSQDDGFSIVTLEGIAAGTTIYFTDNGWSSADGFYGATNTNGVGNETLTQLYFSSSVAAGTLLRFGDDTAEAQWDVSSFVPGATNGDVFSALNLAHATSDQIYAFEAGANPPLYNPSNHIFVLDFGDFNNPGFEDVTSPSTGNVAPGLSQVANTAVTLPDPSFGSDLNDFHNGSFALNMLDADVVALNLAGGTKAQWLAIIADSTNWLRINYESNANGDAQAQLQSLNIAGVPEPSRVLLLSAASGLLIARRRRSA